MQLLGLVKLEAFKLKHANARRQLDAWQADVLNTRWDGPQDVKRRYATASFLANNRVIFNIKGHCYRLLVRIKYQNGIVMIEWIGTHSEYDSMNFNKQPN